MRKISISIAATLLALACSFGFSQEVDPHLLDGYQLEYTYADGGSVVLNFYDGKLKYRWIAGQFEGVEEADRVYQSRQIGDRLYFVSWHDLENRNFVAMVIDLNQNTLSTSALIAYGTKDEATLFDAAIIERVTQGE